MLMDARLVGEHIISENRFVSLKQQAGKILKQFSRRVEILFVYVGTHIIQVPPYFKAHYKFFQRAIAGPFAYPVKRYLNLGRPCLYGGQRIGRGETEIVVTVDRKINGPILKLGHMSHEPLNK